jgi:DNA-binding MarR family transcriptional regulator
LTAELRSALPQSGPRDGNALSQKTRSELCIEFLSAARVFAWSVREVLERSVLRHVAEDKLTFSQLKLLYLVAHTNEHTTIGDAASFLGISNAAASKAVEKLVRRRLLRRSEILGDRRSSQLSLTEVSRRLLEAYEQERDRVALRAFEDFSPEELRATAELLDRLAGVFVRQGADPDHVCLQCEIYYREKCRFGDLGRRNCFYQRRRTDAKQDQPVPDRDGTEIY